MLMVCLRTDCGVQVNSIGLDWIGLVSMEASHYVQVSCMCKYYCTAFIRRILKGKLHRVAMKEEKKKRLNSLIRNGNGRKQASIV